MTQSKTLALLATAAFSLAMLAAIGGDVRAEPDKAKPRDYGVTEGERRETHDPLIVGAFVYGQRCGVCHAKTAGKKNKYGPHLEGIVGREVGSTNWSEQTKYLSSAGGVWTEEALEKLIKDPKKAYPGINMDTKIRFKKSRTALLAYLKTL